jgi:hypothetical protein
MDPFHTRVGRITDQLERLIPHYGDAHRRDSKRVTDLFQQLEHAVEQLKTAIMAKPSTPSLSSAERITTLVDALAALARAKRAALLRLDALHSLLMQYLPAEAARYWANNAGELRGWICDPQPIVPDEAKKTGDACLLQRAPSARAAVVPDELKSQGVLVWWNTLDRHVRLIDARWLDAHADIRAHVAKDWEGGRRCRFCEMPEIGTSRELVAVDPEQRSPLGTINGVVVLQPGTVYVHERCAPYWERWRTIAESYKTQEQAAEADRQAGRTSRAAVPIAEPVAELPPPSGPDHFNADEQRKYR